MPSALIDTNLVLLLVVGMTDRSYINTHKRTRTFTEEDYDLLLSVLNRFDSIWITSHCLAEASNLLKQTHKEKAVRLLSTLSVLGAKTKESHVQKSNIFGNVVYTRLGVADTGFVQKSKRVTCSFTVDFDLYQAISDLGWNVVNFNHLRAEHLYIHN